MPKIVARGILTCIIATITASAAAQIEWRQVSTVMFDWDKHPNIRLTLSIQKSWNDPGDFTRLSVDVPGHNQVVFENDTGWVRYRSGEVSSKVNTYKNLIQSDYLLAAKISQNRTVLFLVGYAYASSPGSLDVLEISDSGEPRRVLHQDELGLKEVRDLDADNIDEIVGFPCLSQEWGNGLLTYDPFNVYKFGKIRGSDATLSVPLSKTYNLRHYYGWAGPQCSEDIAVVLSPPKGGKPILVSAKEAHRLMEPESKH